MEDKKDPPIPSSSIEAVLAKHGADLEPLEAKVGQMDALSSAVKEKAEALAEARLRIIEAQAGVVDPHRRRWLWRLILPQLGVFYQYPPRRLYIPEYYTLARPLASPPTISIVTPTFNQGQFLELTIKSVLEQNYPKLEYIIQDGKSSDQTIEILDRYRKRLSHCESSSDNGQANAINLGFRHASGEIMAYLNSDDLLLPGALHYIARYFVEHPKVDVLYGHRVIIDERDEEIGRWVLPAHDSKVISWADYVPQESLFWRRRIWEKVGARVDESLRFAIDWDLLLRFRDAGGQFVVLPRFLGAFRFHSHQKTSTQMASLGVEEMNRLRERCHGRTVSLKEIRRHVIPYFIRHLIYHKLYRLGLLRY